MGGVRCGIAIAITWFLGWIFVLPSSIGWTAYQNLRTVTPREPTWALVPLATLGVSTLFWGGIFNTIEQDFPKYNPTNSPLPVPRNPKLSKVDHRWVNGLQSYQDTWGSHFLLCNNAHNNCQRRCNCWLLLAAELPQAASGAAGGQRGLSLYL